ncbi:hypothetical protein ACLB2K_003089 [Fragaria x ananassa]
MGRKREIELRPIVFKAPEANDVFIEVKSAGVNIVLEDVTTAITIIEKFLEQYHHSFWSAMTIEISIAIRKELRKSRNVIDVGLIGQFVDYLESTVEDIPEEEEEEEKAEDSDKEEGGSDEEEFSSEEDVEDSDGSESEEIVDSDEDSDDDVAAVTEGKKEVVISSEEIEKFKDPATREICKEDLLLVCRQMGLMVKPGQEGDILHKMYPYIRGGRPYRRSITFFMRRVREHMDRSSTLDDCCLMFTSLTQEEDMADAEDPVNQQLKKNMVPTKEEEEEEEEEEGIASPMNQIKPEEKRECGDIMEIEEMETLTPLNLAEQAKESNAYSSCVKESLEKGWS